MERLAFLSTGETIGVDDLAFILYPKSDAPNLGSIDGTLADATTQFQVDYIRRAIQDATGNVSQAAKSLGLHRSNLYRKMRQLGMDPPV